MSPKLDDPGRPIKKRYRLIACEIAYRELCWCVARSPAIVDVHFLRKGLHDLETSDMLSEIQGAVDATDGELYSAVLLGYALCNNGVVGLVARNVPIVIPRAHDCITFFMCSKQRYREYFDSQPGTYFLTSGWCERDFAVEQDGVYARLGLNRTYEDYVKEYGEENARFIIETVGGWEENYCRLTYIDMGLAGELGYEQEARARAQENGWAFERIEGEWSLLEGLTHGEWDRERFLVVPPGHRVEATGDETIFRTVPSGEAATDE